MITNTHVPCTHALRCHCSPFQARILWLCGCQASELDIKRDEVGATSALAMKANWFIMLALKLVLQKYMGKILNVFVAQHTYYNTSGLTCMS